MKPTDSHVYQRNVKRLQTMKYLTRDPRLELSEEEREDIRNLHYTYSADIRKLAKIYNVSEENIAQVLGLTRAA